MVGRVGRETVMRGEWAGEDEGEFERKVRTREVERGRREPSPSSSSSLGVGVYREGRNEVPRGCKASLIIFCRSHDGGVRLTAMTEIK